MPSLPRFATAVLAAALLLAACGARQPVTPADPGAITSVAANAAAAAPSTFPGLGPLPASYAGELPGASGTVRWHLDLLPGGHYQRRLTFVGRPAPNAFDDIGRFTLDGPRLTLDGGREAPVFLAWRPDGALRKLDTEGRAIASAHNDRLQRLPAAAPIEPRLALTGLFTYMADAPRMLLCADGRSLPVEMAGDYLALERAYGAAVPSPGAPLRVQLDGRIALRPSAEESQPPQPTLVVERFGRVGPGAACPPTPPDRPLLGTDWRLVGIDGVPYTPALPDRPAQLRLEAGRVAGSDGCNRLLGSYAQAGAALRLGDLASTRMACPAGQAEAVAYAAALAKVRHYAVRGNLLELLDDEGSLLLRLRAE